MSNGGGQQQGLDEQQRLLLSLAQQLRQPLMHIARQGELAQLTGDTSSLQDILVSAESALSLIDNYVLSLQAADRHEDVSREPVSAGAVLYDAAHELTPFAQRYGVTLQLEASAAQPIHVNRRNLLAAFVSLGQALIETLGSTAKPAQTPLILSAQRCRYGVVAGLYCSHEAVTVETFKRSKQLHGIVRQPLFESSAGPNTGLFVADSLFKVMATSLKVSRRGSLTGLAAVLPTVNQLQLV